MENNIFLGSHVALFYQFPLRWIRGSVLGINPHFLKGSLGGRMEVGRYMVCLTLFECNNRHIEGGAEIILILCQHNVNLLPLLVSSWTREQSKLEQLQRRLSWLKHFDHNLF
jgi:hypothetical protein